jgi:hypothetical protein
MSLAYPCPAKAEGIGFLHGTEEALIKHGIRRHDTSGGHFGKAEKDIELHGHNLRCPLPNANVI